tara:strand:+ start:88 stop:561 length:474 start_codon:yes stop_codon:yes gene_type:complete
MNFVRIDGWNDYCIHPNGTVLRIYKHKTTELKGYVNHKGYRIVGLCGGGKRKFMRLHRLLAIAFISNPENKRTVDHINRIRDDNRLKNLRWATDREQALNRVVPPPKKITRGGIRRSRYSFQWQYCMNGKPKSKTMKTLAELQKYRKDTLAEYNIII